MAIQFDHFSPQAFERLVQALSVSVLGKGVVIFGNGPDGGREATFEGTVPYPSETDRWDGYIVVQAKCIATVQAFFEPVAARSGSFVATSSELLVELWAALRNHLNCGLA